MIDQHRVSTLIAAGMRRAATRLGSPYAQFRPSGPNTPLGGAPVATILCAFDPQPTLGLVQTEARRNSGGSLLGDASGLLAGDYLSGRDVWFVSHMEPLRPPSCILCNRTVSISSPDTATTTGVNDYGGRTTTTDVMLAANWPGSLLAKSHIEMDPTRLPSDTKAAFFELLLPAIPTVEPVFGLRISDDLGQSYLVSSAELSTSGWRLGLAMQTT